jgi:hypothetical protein
MPQFQIFYLRDSEVDRFRQAAPKEQPQQLKLRHYEEVGQIEAPSAYAAWANLQEQGTQERGIRRLGVGDVVVPEGGQPLLCHFWGFEEAEWAVEGEAREAAGGRTADSGEHAGSPERIGSAPG